MGSCQKLTSLIQSNSKRFDLKYTDAVVEISTKILQLTKKSCLYALSNRKEKSGILIDYRSDMNVD
jgi:hypothetical protein